MKINNGRLISFQIIGYNLEAFFLIFISRLIAYPNWLLQVIKNLKKSLSHGGNRSRKASDGKWWLVCLSPKAS
jgi:hypothetical protein